MCPQVGWRHDAVVDAPKTGFTRCPSCYRRLVLHDEGPAAAIYSHTLSGQCTAHEAPKARAPRKTKKELNAGPSTSPTRLNDWTVMFDG